MTMVTMMPLLTETLILTRCSPHKQQEEVKAGKVSLTEGGNIITFCADILSAHTSHDRSYNKAYKIKERITKN